MTAHDAPNPMKHLRAAAPLVGHEWEIRGALENGEDGGQRTTFEWIPYVEAIHMQMVKTTNGGEDTPPIDAYIYRHPSKGTLNYLGLSDSGRSRRAR